MSILVNENTRLLVQGITGREGSFHAERCQAYGTNLVAGVTPGKGGESVLGGVPVFDSVRDAVDATHAHLNMPATLMWAAGFEDRAATVTFEMPPARGWQVATQLFPTAEPLVFTAPNLQYLLDSPTEFSDFDLRTFTVPDPADNAFVPTFLRPAVPSTMNAGCVSCIVPR